MRCSPRSAVLLGLAVVLTVTGCATPAPTETPAASPSAPAPEPTVEPLVIGPAQMPPIAFGGECAKALSLADVTEVLGAEATLDGSRPEGRTSIDSAGGLQCAWTTPEAQLTLDVIPRSGLNGAAFPEERAARYFDECNDGWFCSWEGGDHQVWLALTFTNQGMTRSEVDAQAEALAPRVLANFATAGDEPWTRDRTGWWPALACDDLAVAVGSQSGDALTGEEGRIEDLPYPGYLITQEGTGHTDCTLYDDAGAVVGRVVTDPGLGAPPLWSGGEPVDLGAPGITALASPIGDTRWVYVMGDGVNRVYVEAGDSSVGTPEQFAVAVAAAAASDFQ